MALLGIPGQITFALQYQIHDLGVFNCVIRDMNDNGQFVGVTTAPSAGIYCYDINGSKTLLHSTGWSSGINNAGQVASSNGIYIPTATGWTNPIGGCITDINNIGQYCGLSSTSGAYFVDSNGYHYIYVARCDTYAECLNDSGVVVGYVRDSYGTTCPFRWTIADGLVYMQRLDTDPDCNSYVWAINSQGYAVGGSAINADSVMSHAVIWNPDGSVTNLTPSTFGTAYGINDAGYIVGTTGYNRPVVWTPELNAVYLPMLANTTGIEPLAINNKDIIVGRCTINEEPHVVYWTPVPEPSSLCTILLGVPFFFSLRRKRK